MTETKTFKGGLWAYLQQSLPIAASPTADWDELRKSRDRFVADAFKPTPFKPGELRQAHVFNRETGEWEKVTYDDSGVQEVERLYE